MKLSRVEKDAKLRLCLILSLEGDEQSYDFFLREVRDLMVAYLGNYSLSRGISSAQREEIVQDILLKIHLKRHTYNLKFPVLPWVYTVAKHCLIDERRGLEGSLNFKEFNEVIDSVESGISRQEAALAFKQEVEIVLKDVPEKQLEILLLAKVDGFTNSELAKKLKTSLSSIKVVIHRTIQKVKERGLK